MTNRPTDPSRRPARIPVRVWSWIAEPWSRDRGEFEIKLLRKIDQLSRHIEHMEELIMATTAEIIARLDAATNEVAADLQAVRDALTAALVDVDAAKRAAVDEALAQLDAPIARLEALGADPANPVPDPEPTPEG
jgi:hypothetical protein